MYIYFFHSETLQLTTRVPVGQSFTTSTSGVRINNYIRTKSPVSPETSWSFPRLRLRFRHFVAPVRPLVRELKKLSRLKNSVSVIASRGILQIPDTLGRGTTSHLG